MKLIVMCKACAGTGVYVGMGEKNGASIVCSRCRGSGAVEEDYTPFTTRYIRDGVKTVASRSHGIVIAPGTDRGEVSYEAFLAGQMPVDDDELYERVTGKKPE